MDPNQNPPFSRIGTEEEKEEFFSSQDAITGLLGGAVAANWSNSQELPAPLTLKDVQEVCDEVERKLFRGVHVTAIAPPDQGWPVAYYCPLCKETVFLLSPYACKPTVDGKEYDGYHVIKDICAHETLGFKHNMELGMKGYYAPIELKPGRLVL